MAQYLLNNHFPLLSKNNRLNRGWSQCLNCHFCLRYGHRNKWYLCMCVNQSNKKVMYPLLIPPPHKPVRKQDVINAKAKHLRNIEYYQLPLYIILFTKLNFVVKSDVMKCQCVVSIWNHFKWVITSRRTIINHSFDVATKIKR